MKKITFLFYCVCLVVIFYSCKQKPKESSTIVTSNGEAIACNICGDADTTLLFVHGWCINKEYWEPQVKYFCPKYKVVTIDLPGFGQSGKNRKEYDFKIYSSDIKNIIDQLQLKNVVLIGHSMSGNILLRADNEFPDLLAGIVGIDNLHAPGAPFTEEQRHENDTFFKMMASSFDSTAAKMGKDLFQPTTDSLIVKRVLNDIFNADSVIATNVLYSLTRSSEDEEVLMKGLSHTLYLLNSDVFPISKDSLNKYCNKGYEAELVHGTGHYPMLEKSSEFNSALQSIINKIGRK